MPHERLGEEVAAAIVPRAGREIDAEQLAEFLKGRIAGFKVPTRLFVFDDPLPRNPAGKILKRQLRDDVTTDE